MWAKVESGSITEVYTNPKQLTIGNIQYPKNIFSLWTEAQLKAIGLYIVVTDNSNLKDEEYYINTTESYALASDTVTKSYGSATAKPLTDVLWTDGEDKPTGVSTGDIKTIGLKSIKKSEVNNQASGILTQTDWYSIRAADGGTAVPSSVSTHRAAVRTKANSMCTQIDNAANVDALAALYVYNSDNPPVRPLGQFPTL
jgi:hypothetical protein